MLEKEYFNIDKIDILAGHFLKDEDLKESLRKVKVNINQCSDFLVTREGGQVVAERCQAKQNRKCSCGGDPTKCQYYKSVKSKALQEIEEKLNQL